MHWLKPKMPSVQKWFSNDKRRERLHSAMRFKRILTNKDHSLLKNRFIFRLPNKSFNY